MADVYAPRIASFREELIRVLPRAPNNRASLEKIRSMPTRQIILAFVTWRLRLIPAKPRMVRYWSGGVAPTQAKIWSEKLRPFLAKVAGGEDLTPHLSDLVMKKGVILPGASPADRGKDIDMILTREGLHHFHIGERSAANPKGRSGTLLFAEVLQDEFRIVAIADHRVFEAGSPEHLRFFETSRAYMAKDIPPGQGFMANPVMSSGHSAVVMLFANRCEGEIDRLDASLDDPSFIDKLYQDQPIIRDGELVSRPVTPNIKWHFDDLKFGILDTSTMVFFCLFPFFSR